MGCMLPAFLMWITYGREVLSLILASAARDIDGREEIKSPGHYALEQEDLRQWINTAGLQLSRRLTDALFPSSILKTALLCDDERINIKLSARSDSKLLQKILTNSQGEDSCMWPGGSYFKDVCSNCNIFWWFRFPKLCLHFGCFTI